MSSSVKLFPEYRAICEIMWKNLVQRDRPQIRRPRHFEWTLATALARSDAAWLFLVGISERES